MQRIINIEAARKYLTDICKVFKFRIETLTDEEMARLMPLIKNKLGGTADFCTETLVRQEAEVVHCLQKRHVLDLILQGTPKDCHALTASHYRDKSPEPGLTLEEFGELHNEVIAFSTAEMTALRESCDMTALSLRHYLGIGKTFPQVILADGSDNIIQEMQERVRQGLFTERDLALWKWCGLLELLTLNAGVNASHYTSQYHAIQKTTAEEINKVIVNPDYPFFENMLAARAQIMQLDKTDLTANECVFLAYLAVKFNNIPAMSVKQRDELIVGYQKFKVNYPDVDLAERFVSFRKNQQTNGMALIPEILNRIYDHYVLLERVFNESAIEKTAELMSVCLTHIFSFSVDKPVALQELFHAARGMAVHAGKISFIERDGQLVLRYPLSNTQLQVIEAAKNGDVETLENIAGNDSLDSISNFDPDCDGNTPLMLALQNGHANAALFLLSDRNTRCDQTNNQGKTLTEFASMHPSCQLIAKIIKKEVSVDEMCLLIKERNEHAIIALVKNMGNICTLEKDGCDLMAYLIRDGSANDALWLTQYVLQGMEYFVRAFIVTDYVPNMIKFASEQDEDLRVEMFKMAILEFAKTGRVELVARMMAQMKGDDLRSANENAVVGYASGGFLREMENIIHSAEPYQQRRLVTSGVQSLIAKNDITSVQDALRIMVQIKSSLIRYQLATAVPMAMAARQLRANLSARQFVKIDVELIYKVSTYLRAIISSKRCSIAEACAIFSGRFTDDVDNLPIPPEDSVAMSLLPHYLLDVFDGEQERRQDTPGPNPFI